MFVRQSRRRAAVSGRGSFTLIELLVVIAIIAVLVSLTTAAAMRVLGAAPRVQTQTEISKMSEALTTAKRGGFVVKDIENLPSYLILYEDVGQYQADTSPDAQASAKALSKMFGSRVLTNGNQVNWNGDGKPNKRKFILEGDQALIFYLGGIPYPNSSLTGFSNDPVNPAKQGGTRIGSFYTFDQKRLVTLNSNGNSPGFYSFLDPYGAPYAYFAAQSSNNYYYTTTGTAANPRKGSDCASINANPYMSSATEWANKDTFQIVSAGQDKAFGPGINVWTAQNGSTDPATKDNLSNFTKGLMQAPTR
jgi:prepilin-type N-terminal cleavage/methylation domain-containing protein